MADLIVIAPIGGRWAIKHNGGVLGYAGGREEAGRVAQSLIEWLEDQGRSADLEILDDRDGD